MNCPEWELPIALWVEGDLASGGDDVDAIALARHLVSCQACSSFAEELRTSQHALHCLAEREVSAVPLSAVRARVFSKIGRPLWINWVALGCAAAGLAVALLFWPLPPPERLTIAAWKPPAPAAAFQHFNPPARLQRLPAPLTAESPFIRLETDDENVVIYWIADEKGDRP